MQKKQYIPLSLLAVAVLSGCGSMYVAQNSFLTEAHTNYDRAQSDPQVMSQAAVELKEAGDSLIKADAALNKGESIATVNHLAYLANQQVAIAQETTKRKTAESVVADASAKRDQVRLEARTAEVDVAKRETEATKQQMADVQKVADQQAAELSLADAKMERDRALIAKQEMQLKELNAKKTERGLVITLGDVLFNSGNAQLKSAGINNVQKLADFLEQYPQQKVLIEGHTDSTGGDSLNLDLSDRRANAVRIALIDNGINSDRIIIRGYGEAYPVADNDTITGRQLNRRVEIILSDENGNIILR